MTRAHLVPAVLAFAILGACDRSASGGSTASGSSPAAAAASPAQVVSPQVACAHVATVAGPLLLDQLKEATEAEMKKKAKNLTAEKRADLATAMMDAQQKARAEVTKKCLADLEAEQRRKTDAYAQLSNCIMQASAVSAIDACMNNTCSNLQGEARGNLKALYVGEESYRAENDTYGGAGLSWSAETMNACTTDANCSDGRVCLDGTCILRNILGFVPKGSKSRNGGRIAYRYKVLEATATTFRAEARGTGAAEGDVWTITHLNDLQNANNACGR